ncbi:MAG: hypothetical protein PUB20_00105 [Clostridia bacterium]|nr:hypothetical protein [Clostridia bacterium]
MISIIEKSMISKNPDISKCEDGLYISDDFIAVVDGVTAKGEMKWNGMTSGCYAKELILSELTKLDPDICAEDAIMQLNSRLTEAYGSKADEFKNNPKEQLQACIIIYSAAKKQIWNFGDCQCIINGKFYSHEKQIDVIMSNMRSLFLELEMLSGKTVSELKANDTGRKFIQPILEKQALFANSPSMYGFDNLNGFELCLDRIRIYNINYGDQIVLASDGYPSLQPSLAVSEEILKKTLEEDPLCCKSYKSTKGFNPENVSFDDRTYIRFTV